MASHESQSVYMAVPPLASEKPTPSTVHMTMAIAVQAADHLVWLAQRMTDGLKYE